MITAVASAIRPPAPPGTSPEPPETSEDAEDEVSEVLPAPYVTVSGLVAMSAAVDSTVASVTALPNEIVARMPPAGPADSTTESTLPDPTRPSRRTTMSASKLLRSVSDKVSRAPGKVRISRRAWRHLVQP